MNTDRDFLLGEARRLLDFGRAAGLPSGGAAYLDDDGRPDPARGVHTWITARTVHSQALGHLLGVPGSREVAELALRGLWSDDASRPALLHDDEHGGWFNAVSAAGEPTAAGSKLAYDHSFVMLAGASATLAGLAGGPELLAEATGVFLERFWDEEYGRPVDTWNRDFTTADPYRGLNSTMHTVEALLTVSSAVRYLRHGGDGGHCCRAEPAEGGPAAVAYRDSETHHRHAPSVPALPTSLGTPCAWIRRALHSAEFVVGLAGKYADRLPEHFGPDWVPNLELNADRPGDQFKPYGATPGHGLEWGRLLLHLEGMLEHSGAGRCEQAAVLRPQLLPTAVALFDRAVADAWDDGFAYTTGWDGAPVVRTRMHWVVCEGIATAHSLFARTGEPRFGEWYGRFWDYAREHLLDLERGSWHHELDEQNRPTATVWPGKPDIYHALQCALIPLLPLTPMLPAALLSHRVAIPGA